MALSDAQFRIGTVGAALVLAAGITAARFCGRVSLPSKPERLTLEAPINNAALRTYEEYLASDAAIAGVRTPTHAEMMRKLVYRVDDGRKILEQGDPPIDVAGLRLAARRSGSAVVLEIVNTTKSDLGYIVVTEPAPNIVGCDAVPASSFNAVVIEKAQREVRVECAWRNGMAIVVRHVETVELSGLSAWYVAQVPPSQLGIDDRVSRGHRMPRNQDRCISLVSQSVRVGLENAEIAWRDLVDFYARHRCQTYQFPSSYRAFTTDAQREIPAS